MSSTIFLDRAAPESHGEEAQFAPRYCRCPSSIFIPEQATYWWRTTPAIRSNERTTHVPMPFSECRHS
jgi:hypothetical protein